MSAIPPVSLTLDRPRLVRWSHDADFYLGSLERPPAVRDIAHSNPARAFHALCCFIWAALVERDFAEPVALAPLLGTPEAQLAALQALKQAMRDAGVLAPEKKTVPKLARENAVSATANGPTASSNLAPVVPITDPAPPPSGPR